MIEAIQDRNLAVSVKIKYWLRSQDCVVKLSKERLTRPLSCHLVILFSSMTGSNRPPPLSPLQGPTPGENKVLAEIKELNNIS